MKKNKVSCPLSYKAKTAIKIFSTLLSSSIMAVATCTTVSAFDINKVNASGASGRIVGVLCMIARYIGCGMIAYGVYDIVMSFTQSSAEAKVKGIAMAISGAVMVSMPTVITAIVSGNSGI